MDSVESLNHKLGNKTYINKDEVNSATVSKHNSIDDKYLTFNIRDDNAN